MGVYTDEYTARQQGSTQSTLLDRQGGTIIAASPGPLYGQQMGQGRGSPEQPRQWMSPLLWLVVFIALLGCVATIFALVGKPFLDNEIALPVGTLMTSINQAAMLLDSLLFLVCIAGICLAPSTLMRVGFLFGAFAARSLLLSAFLDSGLLRGGGGNEALSNTLWIVTYPTMANVEFTVPGTICLLFLSYGWIRWQSSDKQSIWVQLLFVFGVGVVLLMIPYLPQHYDSGLVLVFYDSTPFLALAGMACFLLRPACWQASAPAVLCLTAGQVLSLLANGDLFFLWRWPSTLVESLQALAGVNYYQVGPLVLGLQITAGMSFAGETLLIIGLLLLIHNKRLRKKMLLSGSLGL